MSDPMDLDKLAAEVRERIGRDEESAPTPWSVRHVTMEEHRAGGAVYTTFYVMDAHNNYVAEAMSPTDVDILFLARNALVPLLDDRDRLKAEVALLEGILGDAALDSPDTPRVLQLETRVRVLEEALRPFGEWAVAVDDRQILHHRDEVSALLLPPAGNVRVGDLRHAARVLEMEG